MDWLRDHMWESWLALAVVLGVLELVSLDLFLVMLAGGALVGAVTALVGGPIPLQAVLALVSAVGLLGVIRPGVVRRLHSGPDLKTGAEALIGKRATVLRELVHGTPGRVKIGGEEWTAEPYDEDDRIEAGEVVDVVQIKGATAYVLRVHRLGS
ncbi:MAG: NfeD family protein [Marmoricola sp.]|jgi:membrane protein implicated in regulation of membrane protease activity|nr:NfeD family protein [Marmoricola sp.]MCW2821566.1 NfeD family protein [Marmoricola sp.]MCW2826913.1 NfeD family protein [Marmoricola sp.]